MIMYRIAKQGESAIIASGPCVYGRFIRHNVKKADYAGFITAIKAAGYRKVYTYPDGVESWKHKG